MNCNDENMYTWVYLCLPNGGEELAEEVISDRRLLSIRIPSSPSSKVSQPPPKSVPKQALTWSIFSLTTHLGQWIQWARRHNFLFQCAACNSYPYTTSIYTHHWKCTGPFVLVKLYLSIICHKLFGDKEFDKKEFKTPPMFYCVPTV